MVDKKQQQMKEQITAFMTKKQYYDILGVPKNADPSQIKNAYRKLALRFHPDKNSVEGSKQVFKKISNAYTTLIDQQLRANYDRYGPQQNQPQHTRHRHYQSQNQQFDEYQQIFRAFFGQNVMFGNNARHFRFQAGARHHQTNHQQQQRKGGINFMHVFLLFSLFMMFAPKLFQPTQYYDLYISNQFRIKRQTNLEFIYYVREDFEDYIRNTREALQRIEQQVDLKYITKLRGQCENNMKIKKSYQKRAYEYNDMEYRQSYLDLANKVDMSSCKKFNSLRQNHRNYLDSILSN